MNHVLFDIMISKKYYEKKPCRSDDHDSNYYSAIETLHIKRPNHSLKEYYRHMLSDSFVRKTTEIANILEDDPKIKELNRLFGRSILELNENPRKKTSHQLI